MKILSMIILIYNALHYIKKSSFIDYKQFFDNLLLKHFNKFDSSIVAIKITILKNLTLEVFDAKLIGYDN